MRHHNKNRKLGRVKKQRTALLRSLARSLILRNKIKTTEAKAKELRPFVEKLISKSKIDTVASRRLVVSRLASKIAAARLFDTLASKYGKRAGGYTRITKLGARGSDSAKEAIIEFVE